MPTSKNSFLAWLFLFTVLNDSGILVLVLVEIGRVAGINPTVTIFID